MTETRVGRLVGRYPVGIYLMSIFLGHTTWISWTHLVPKAFIAENWKFHSFNNNHSMRFWCWKYEKKYAWKNMFCFKFFFSECRSWARWHLTEGDGSDLSMMGRACLEDAWVTGTPTHRRNVAGCLTPVVAIRANMSPTTAREELVSRIRCWVWLSLQDAPSARFSWVQSTDCC